jgi:hypothetical protein
MHMSQHPSTYQHISSKAGQHPTSHPQNRTKNQKKKKGTEKHEIAIAAAPSAPKLLWVLNTKKGNLPIQLSYCHHHIYSQSTRLPPSVRTTVPLVLLIIWVLQNPLSFQSSARLFKSPCLDAIHKSALDPLRPVSPHIIPLSHIPKLTSLPPQKKLQNSPSIRLKSIRHSRQPKTPIKPPIPNVLPPLFLVLLAGLDAKEPTARGVVAGLAAVVGAGPGERLGEGSGCAEVRGGSDERRARGGAEGRESWHCVRYVVSESGECCRGGLL